MGIVVERKGPKEAEGRGQIDLRKVTSVTLEMGHLEPLTTQYSTGRGWNILGFQLYLLLVFFGLDGMLTEGKGEEGRGAAANRTADGSPIFGNVLGSANFPVQSRVFLFLLPHSLFPPGRKMNKRVLPIPDKIITPLSS